MINEVIELNNLFNLPNSDKCHATITAYIPEEIHTDNYNSTPRKSIIICPGGGLLFCSPRCAENVAMKFVGMGFNAFVLNYSLKPNAYPQQSLELCAAMETLYLNAEKWLVDTSKIAVIGFSAGGYVASFYTNTYMSDEIRKYFPESKKPNALLLGYAVNYAEKKFTSARTIFNLLLKDELNDEEIEFFTSSNHITPDSPPVFIFHTAEDKIVNVNHCLEYAIKLKENNVPFELNIYPYGYHGISTCDDTSCKVMDEKIYLAHEWLDNAEKWLNIVLG